MKTYIVCTICEVTRRFVVRANSGEQAEQVALNRYAKSPPKSPWVPGDVEVYYTSEKKGETV